MYEGEEGGRGQSGFCGRSGWTFLLAPLMSLPGLLETTRSRRVPADACVCRRNEVQSEKTARSPWISLSLPSPPQHLSPRDP